MKNLLAILKQYWGYESFLPLQAEAIGAVVSYRDSLVILPTGGGKSLCFQAPAMALPGMAVVVSPLISLMKDQVDALRANGIEAACIHSGMLQSERTGVHQAMQDGRLKLLYVAAERIVQPSFINYLRDANPSFIVIDEAHCISHWGHDFRPDYRLLSTLREAFPDLALHAYTATATDHVREDIVRELRLRDPEVLVGSFDRPNLIYRVEPRSNGFAQVLNVINRHPSDSGVIYCIRRKDVDELCAKLNTAGHKALPYHAGLSDTERKHNQEAFIREKADIIVATVAFGMGIDKSNVRYVVHTGMPKSIEHYQQESGRAGRDGLEAECCLFYSGGDFGLWRSIIEKSENEGGDVAVEKLRAMYSYCVDITCRHRALVTYFGQSYPNKPCGACDACLGHFHAMEGSSDIAAAILKCVNDLGPMAGPSYTTLVLSGSKEHRVLSKGHDGLDGYGALASYESRRVRDWVEQLVSQGYLEKTGEYSILELTADGRAALSGQCEARLTKPVDKGSKRDLAAAGLARAAKKGVPEGPYDEALFQALRRLRREKADENNVPPFVIFSDATLRDMARRKPVDATGFLAVHGVGRAKCDAFGDEFLAAIRAYGNGDVLPTPPGPEETEDREKKRGAAQLCADELFSEGRSIAEVCEIMGRQPGTVEQYLAKYIEAHGVTDPTRWVDPAVYERIRAAAMTAENVRLKPVYEQLNGEVSYGDIRVSLACLQNQMPA